MSGYKLYYFNVRGRGELARLAFAAANIEFEDIRLTGDEWAVEKASEYNMYRIEFFRCILRSIMRGDLSGRVDLISRF